MTVDITGIASNVYGIAGMGIGLGLLAGTARNVARSTDTMYERSPRARPRPRQQRRRKQFDDSFSMATKSIRLDSSKYSFKW